MAHVTDICAGDLVMLVGSELIMDIIYEQMRHTLRRSTRSSNLCQKLVRSFRKAAFCMVSR